MKSFGIIFGVVVLFILSSIWSGLVLSILWGWFVVPAFHLPPLSIALAIGLTIVVRMFVGPSEEKSEKKDEGMMGAVVMVLLYPLMVLGIGALVHLFV